MLVPIVSRYRLTIMILRAARGETMAITISRTGSNGAPMIGWRRATPARAG